MVSSKIVEQTGLWGLMRVWYVPSGAKQLYRMICGLQLCWTRSVHRVKVFTDCAEAINLISRNNEEQHPFRDIIEQTRSLRHRVASYD